MLHDAHGSRLNAPTDMSSVIRGSKQKEIIAPEREVALLFPDSEAISGQNVIFYTVRIALSMLLVYVWFCTAVLSLLFLTALKVYS